MRLRQEDVTIPAAMDSAMWIDHKFAAWKRGPWIPALLRRATDDLQRYYQRPIQEIAARYWEARAPADSAAPAAVLDHYQATEQYIYESSMFDAVAEQQWCFEQVRRACTQFRRTPVLDFGGGAGGLALSLAGVPCDYADIPGRTLDFARWRFERHACPVRVLDATEPLPAGAYQAIVTLDVLEHLPDIRATLGRLAAALAPGGWLITKSTFAGGDPMHLPQNLRYADFRQFDRLMIGCGLRYRGRIRPDPISEWRFKQLRRPRIWRVWLDRKPKFGGRWTVHELVS